MPVSLASLPLLRPLSSGSAERWGATYNLVGELLAARRISIREAETLLSGAFHHGATLLQSEMTQSARDAYVALACEPVSPIRGHSWLGMQGAPDYRKALLHKLFDRGRVTAVEMEDLTEPLRVDYATLVSACDVDAATDTAFLVFRTHDGRHIRLVLREDDVVRLAERYGDISALPDPERP